MYNLFRLGSVIIPRLPRWFILALSIVTGTMAWLFASKARKQATINMIHVLGPEIQSTRAGRRKLRRIVRGMFQNSMRNYLEVFYLPHETPETILRRIPHISGTKHLEDALALGKGVILFSAHFGPFDYLAQWFYANDYQLTIPVERLKDGRMLDLMVSLRSSKGVHFIPLGGSAPMRTIIQALRNNQIVLITGDRAVQGESVEKPFFGAMARLPVGPAALSIRTGAPLVGAFGWHASQTHIAGEFVPLTLELPEEKRKNTDALMCGLIERMERIIKAHPDQWVVFSSIWTTEPRS